MTFVTFFAVEYVGLIADVVGVAAVVVVAVVVVVVVAAAAVAVVVAAVVYDADVMAPPEKFSSYVVT